MARGAILCTWRAMLCLGCFILAGCAAGRGAPQPPAHAAGRVVAWPLAELAGATGARAVLAAGDKPVALLPTTHLQAAWVAASRLLDALPAEERPTLLITEGQAPNAFVFFNARRPHIAANLGMLALLADDTAAWAALYGHEIAHLRQRHRETRAERKAATQTTSELLGLALTVAGVPLGDVIADSATTLIERGYTRDEERAADRLGVEMMVRAGFDPQGAVRLQERLAGAGASASLPFLSTHPGSAERVENMRALVRELDSAAPAR